MNIASEENSRLVVSKLRYSLDNDLNSDDYELVRSLLVRYWKVDGRQDYGLPEVLKECLVKEARQPHKNEISINFKTYIIVVNYFMDDNRIRDLKSKLAFMIVRPFYACLKRYKMYDSYFLLDLVAYNFKILKKLVNKHFCKFMVRIYMFEDCGALNYFLRKCRLPYIRKYFTSSVEIFILRSIVNPLPKARKPTKTSFHLQGLELRASNLTFVDSRADIEKRYPELTDGDSSLDFKTISEMLKRGERCRENITIGPDLSLKMSRYVYRNLGKDKEAMKTFLDCFATISLKNGRLFSWNSDKFAQFIIMVKRSAVENINMIMYDNGCNKYTWAELMRFWDKTVYLMDLLYRLHDFNNSWFNLIDLSDAPSLVNNDLFQIRTNFLFDVDKKYFTFKYWIYTLVHVCPPAFNEYSVMKMEPPTVEYKQNRCTYHANRNHVSETM